MQISVKWTFLHFCWGSPYRKGIIGTLTMTGPSGKAKETPQGFGERNLLFPVGAVNKCFVLPLSLKIKRKMSETLFA